MLKIFDDQMSVEDEVECESIVSIIEFLSCLSVEEIRFLNEKLFSEIMEQ